jgi:glutathione S-transferase
MSMSRAASTAATAVVHKTNHHQSSLFKLIGAAWTRAFRCVWMLEELGIPYQIMDHDPGSASVQLYNPSGKVPVLLEYNNSDDAVGNKEEQCFILTESTAINTYLGDCFPESGLVPPHAIASTATHTARYYYDRARYDSTIAFISNELDSQALWAYRKHVAMGQHFGHVPEMADISRAHFDKCNALIAQQLVSPHNDDNNSTHSISATTSGGGSGSGGPYLLGAHFTAADILYIHCLDWAKGLQWHTAWPPHLITYRQLCHARPAYQRTKTLRDEMQMQQKKKQKPNSSNTTTSRL